jgi:hypothetical protein
MSSSKDQQDNCKEIKNLVSPSIKDIRDASKNIASKAIKTPLVRLNYKPKYQNQNDELVRDHNLIMIKVLHIKH